MESVADSSSCNAFAFLSQNKQSHTTDAFPTVRRSSRLRELNIGGDPSSGLTEGSTTSSTTGGITVERTRRHTRISQLIGSLTSDDTPSHDSEGSMEPTARELSTVGRLKTRGLGGGAVRGTLHSQAELNSPIEAELVSGSPFSDITSSNANTVNLQSMEDVTQNTTTIVKGGARGRLGVKRLTGAAAGTGTISIPNSQVETSGDNNGHESPTSTNNENHNPTAHIASIGGVAATSSTSARRAAALINAQRLISRETTHSDENATMSDLSPNSGRNSSQVRSSHQHASNRTTSQPASPLTDHMDDIDVDNDDIEGIHKRTLRRARAKAAATAAASSSATSENAEEANREKTSISPNTQDKRNARHLQSLSAEKGCKRIRANEAGVEETKVQSDGYEGLNVSNDTTSTLTSDFTTKSFAGTEDITNLRRQLVKQARTNALLDQEKAEAEKEKKNLQTQLTDKTQLLEAEMKKRQQFEKELQDMKAELDLLKSLAREKEQESSMAQERAENAESKLESVMKEAERRIKETEARVSEKENELMMKSNELQTVNERLAKELASVKIEVGCLSTKYNASAAQLQSQALETEHIRLALEDGEKKLANTLVEISTLRDQNEALQTKCSNYKSAVMQFKEAVAEAAKDLKEQEDMIQSERTAREKAENSLSKLSDEISEANEQISNLQSDLDEKIEHLESVQEKLARATEENARMIGELQDFQEELKDANDTIEELQKHVERLRSVEHQLDSLKASTENITQNLELKESELQEKSKQILALENTASQSRDVLEAKNEELSVLTQKLSHAENRITELEGLLSASRSEIVQTHEALLKSQSMLSEAASKFEGRERSMAQEADERLAHLLAEIQTLKSEAIAKDEVRRQLHNELLDLKGSIRVFCRIRPAGKAAGDITNSTTVPPVTFNSKSTGLVEALEVTTIAESVTKEKRAKTYGFKFDRVFTPSHSQQHLFEELTCFVTSALDGFSVSVFAYGQTGSGKTYTMTGPDSCYHNTTYDSMSYLSDEFGIPQDSPSSLNPDRGIIPRAVEQIFGRVREREQQNWTFSLRASMVEIYNEQIRDLLASLPGSTCSQHPLAEMASQGREAQNAIEEALLSYQQGTVANHDPNNCNILQTKSGKVYVQDLKTIDVSSPSDVYKLIFEANKRRKVGVTAANSRSSRSHTVFQLWIQGSFNGDSTNPTQPCDQKSSTANPLPVSAVISLVDLAGSERLDKSKAFGETLKEAQCINSSLAALSQCMDAIAKKRDHIPYRNSKLTYLLKDSLGGNSKTLFVTNIAADSVHLQESLCTLRFAEGLKNIELGPRVTNSNTNQGRR